MGPLILIIHFQISVQLNLVLNNECHCFKVVGSLSLFRRLNDVGATCQLGGFYWAPLRPGHRVGGVGDRFSVQSLMTMVHEDADPCCGCMQEIFL